MSQEKKNNFVPVILIGGVIVAAIYFNSAPGGGGGGGDDDKIIDGSSSSLYPEPTDPSMKQQVLEITKALKGDKHAIHLASFYRRVALAIFEEASNSEQARFIHERSGNALQKVSPYTAHHPDIHPIAENFVSNIATNKNIRLGEQEKRKLKDAFMAIAWACWMAADDKKAEEPRMASASNWNENQFKGLISDEAEIQRLEAISNEVPAGIPGIDPKMSLQQLVSVTAKKVTTPFPANRGPPDNPITHGLRFDEAEYKTFAAKAPRFSDLGYGATGEGKVRLLYQSLLKMDPEAFSEKQTTGDCTSHGCRNACDVSRAFEIDVLGQHESFIVRGATEPIYGYRGHAGQGMSIVRAVQFVNDYAGVPLRKAYGSVDLSVYNSRTGENWGKRGGVPSGLLSEVREHQMGKASLVKTVDEARDAIYNGFALVVGSDHSFSSRRDSNGVAARTPQGWAHCMAWVAVDDTMPDGPWFLVQNSWGRWNGGPKGKYNIPDGSFWIKAKDAKTMIAQRQSVAVGNFNGFEPLPLDNWGFKYLTVDPNGPDDSAHTDPFIGSVPFVSAALANLKIAGGGVDGNDGGGGVVTPENCPRKDEKDRSGRRIHKDGWIVNGDGHLSPCPECNPDGKRPRPRMQPEAKAKRVGSVPVLTTQNFNQRRISCEVYSQAA